MDDILDHYDFEYAKYRLVTLSKKVKEVIDGKTHYPAWDERADLVVLLSGNEYSPIAHQEAYKEPFKQAEYFKRNQDA